MSEADRIAIRRKIQLAQEKQKDILTSRSNEYKEEEYKLSDEILYPDTFISEVQKLDANKLLPTKSEKTFFSFWNTCPFSATMFCFAIGSYMGMLFCASNSYSTHVLNKFAQWNSFARVLVLAAVPIDAYFFWNAKDNIAQRYINALRINQRDYYEKKWGIPERLKDTIESDPFWKEVEARKCDPSEKV